MSTKTREELKDDYILRIEAAYKHGPYPAIEEVAKCLAELADQRHPDERVTGAPCTGAEFVAAAQSAISPRSDEEMQDIIASVTGEPAPVEATPPGEVVTTELDKLIGGCPDWMRMSGIACYDVRTAARRDQLEAVRRARETLRNELQVAFGKTEKEYRQTIADLRRELCDAHTEAAPPGEPKMERLEIALWDDHEGDQLSKAELALIAAGRADAVEAVRRAREADAKTIAELRRELCDAHTKAARLHQQDEETNVELRQTIARVVEARNSLLDEAINLRQQVERLTGERDANATAARELEELRSMAKLVGASVADTERGARLLGLDAGVG